METYIHEGDDAHDTNGLFPFISTLSNATPYYRHVKKKKIKNIRRARWKKIKINKQNITWIEYNWRINRGIILLFLPSDSLIL